MRIDRLQVSPRSVPGETVNGREDGIKNEGTENTAGLCGNELRHSERRNPHAVLAAFLGRTKGKNPPMLFRFHQHPQHLLVQEMTRFFHDKVTDDRKLDKGEIANKIEDLMSDKLILKSQSVFVEDSEIVNHHRII